MAMMFTSETLFLMTIHFFHHSHRIQRVGDVGTQNQVVTVGFHTIRVTIHVQLIPLDRTVHSVSWDIGGMAKPVKLAWLVVWNVRMLILAQNAQLVGIRPMIVSSNISHCLNSMRMMTEMDCHQKQCF
jgi:hypothetical protein